MIEALLTKWAKIWVFSNGVEISGDHKNSRFWDMMWLKKWSKQWHHDGWLIDLKKWWLLLFIYIICNVPTCWKFWNLLCCFCWGAAAAGLDLGFCFLTVTTWSRWNKYQNLSSIRSTLWFVACKCKRNLVFTFLAGSGSEFSLAWSPFLAACFLFQSWGSRNV